MGYFDFRYAWGCGCYLCFEYVCMFTSLALLIIDFLLSATGGTLSSIWGGRDSRTLDICSGARDWTLYVHLDDFANDSVHGSNVRVLRTQTSLHCVIFLLPQYGPFVPLWHVVWQVPTAVAQNIATILVSRFLTGFSGSAFLSVAGGSITDMWVKEQVSWPMVIYTMGPFLGPTIGPVVGGFINQHTSWRWTFYVLLLWGGAEVRPSLDVDCSLLFYASFRRRIVLQFCTKRRSL